MTDKELQSLHAELARLKSQIGAFDHIREGVQILDRDFRYLYVNPAAASHGQTVPDALVGRTLPEMYPGVEQTEMFERLGRCLHRRLPDAMENLFTFPDGSKRWFELRMEPVPDGVMVLSIDIHDRKRLEEELDQARRLEALGRLASGLAHDFNNYLTVIESCTRFLAETVRHVGGAEEDLEHIRQASGRAAALTRQLLTLGRRKVVEPVPTDIDEAVSSLDPLLRRAVGARVELSIEPDCQGTVDMDPSQLDQVLVNLVTNANDAMPDGGRLVVQTERVDGGPNHDVPPGPWALISVSDTGKGMTPDVRARVFEPFFTTKPPRKGTGLGLATSHAIVTQAGGHLRVDSEPGRGTTFRAYLPVQDRPAEQRRSPRPHTSNPDGAETVMVVDDDPALRTICERALTSFGYTVVTASGWEEAIELAESFHAPIDAVLTDVVMPEMRGPELVGRLREIRPELRVLYMSGYADDATFGALDGRNHVQKPFTPAELASHLRAVLDRPARAAS